MLEFIFYLSAVIVVICVALRIYVHIVTHEDEN